MGLVVGTLTRFPADVLRVGLLLFTIHYSLFTVLYDLLFTCSGKPMTERIHNFSAGPAVLPVPVLEEAQRDMLSLPGVGMSVMEISHRSKTFDGIINGAESGLRELLSIPENYHLLFLQGGASLQFSMVPMNFLPKDGSADYIITGSWGKKALKEARRSGAVNVAATMADGGFTRVPGQGELNLHPQAAYV